MVVLHADLLGRLIREHRLLTSVNEIARARTSNSYTRNTRHHDSVRPRNVKATLTLVKLSLSLIVLVILTSGNLSSNDQRRICHEDLSLVTLVLNLSPRHPLFGSERYGERTSWCWLLGLWYFKLAKDCETSFMCVANMFPKQLRWNPCYFKGRGTIYSWSFLFL